MLAWVSNSQNKPENRSPTDWDDWGSDSDLLAEADRTTVARDENMKRYGFLLLQKCLESRPN